MPIESTLLLQEMKVKEDGRTCGWLIGGGSLMCRLHAKQSTFRKFWWRKSMAVQNVGSPSISCLFSFTSLPIFFPHRHTYPLSSVTLTTMTINPVGQPLQAFRSRSTGEVSNIPTLTDPKTGQYIVLWRDIKSAFKNAESLWNGNSMITFLTDENLEQ